jgi:phage-related protein
MGYALFLAQMGERHATMARTLKGFAGGSVIEVRESYAGNAYRAVYTVRFAEATMCFTLSRRSRRPASRHRNRTST